MTKQEALDLLYEGDLYDAFGYVTANGYAALAALDGIVLQERKTGEWEYVGKEHTTFFHQRIYRCSACGNFLDFDGVNCGRGDANYCPNCGAKMEVDE